MFSRTLIFAWPFFSTQDQNEAWPQKAHHPISRFLPGKSARWIILNLPRQNCLKSAWARAQVFQEFLRVPGLSEEELRLDLIQAVALDLAQVPAQAAE